MPSTIENLGPYAKPIIKFSVICSPLACMARLRASPGIREIWASPHLPDCFLTTPSSHRFSMSSPSGGHLPFPDMSSQPSGSLGLCLCHFLELEWSLPGQPSHRTSPGSPPGSRCSLLWPHRGDTVYTVAPPTLLPTKL